MTTIESIAAEKIAQPVADRHSLPQTIALHLLPGLAIVLAYALLASLLRPLGWPSLAALTLTGLVVLIPLLLGLLYRQARVDASSGINAKAAVPPASLLTLLPGLSAAQNQQLLPYQQKTPLWQASLLVVGCILLAGVAMGALNGITQAIMQSFNWLPGWFFLVEDFSVYPKPVMIVTAVFNILFLSFLAPWAEELYFRGYLLPRVSWLKGWAPVLGAALFTLYHFWTPWMFFARFLAVLPMAAVAYWKKDLRLGIWTHCLLNLIDGISILVLAIG